MRANHSAENVLGTIGTVLWSGQLLPQIWKSWREKSTLGLSGMLMFIWATSAVFLGVYNIVQDINIPLIVQPQLFGALAALSWVQCLYYGGKKSRNLCVAIYLIYLAIFAGFEAGVAYGIRDYRDRDDDDGDRAVQFFGIFSAVLVSVGLIPQYIEIYKLKEVIGISLVFLSIDMAGGVFSLLSLVFRDKFDVTASITYICVVVLDGVVVICAIVLNPRARRRREREARLSAAADGQDSKPPLSTEGNLASPSDLEKGVHAHVSLKSVHEEFQPTSTQESTAFEAEEKLQPDDATLSPKASQSFSLSQTNDGSPPHDSISESTLKSPTALNTSLPHRSNDQ